MRAYPLLIETVGLPPDPVVVPVSDRLAEESLLMVVGAGDIVRYELLFDKETNGRKYAGFGVQKSTIRQIVVAGKTEKGGCQVKAAFYVEVTAAGLEGYLVTKVESRERVSPRY
jgi:hypothetical protein